MTAQTHAIAFIPLNRLVAAPRNVRRGNRKADIDVRAASIAARGLLQNFCVTPGKGERFEVEAARAFCLVDNHKQRKAVFRSLGRPVTHAASVRARPMAGRMRAAGGLALTAAAQASIAA